MRKNRDKNHSMDFEALKLFAEDLPYGKRRSPADIEEIVGKEGATEESPCSKQVKRRKEDLEVAEPIEMKRAGSSLLPFVAPAPNKFRERFADTCLACFSKSIRCDHSEEGPLRLLLIGHNPSDHAWKSGFFYSNPSNRMWNLLTGGSMKKQTTNSKQEFVGVLPFGLKIESQNELPGRFGVGLTDLGLMPGSNATAFGKGTLQEWADGLCKRLAAHEERAGKAPAVVAFTGKTQFRAVFLPNDPGKVYHGEWRLPMPEKWPFSQDETAVWVLPSSSGRAVMTNEQRVAPYRELAESLPPVTNGPGVALYRAASS